MYASRPAVLSVILLCVVAIGCTPGSKPRPSDSESRSEAPTSPAAVVSPAGEPASGAPTPATKKPSEPGKLVSLDDARLRALTPATGEVAKKLVTAATRGDLKVTETLFLRSEQLEQVLSEGHRAILGGHLVLKNKKGFEALSEVLRGKNPEYTFEPGPISWSPSNAFQPGIPVMNQGTVKVQVDGISMSLDLQLVYLEKNWLIFRLTG